MKKLTSILLIFFSIFLLKTKGNVFASTINIEDIFFSIDSNYCETDTIDHIHFGPRVYSSISSNGDEIYNTFILGKVATVNFRKKIRFIAQLDYLNGNFNSLNRELSDSLGLYFPSYGLTRLRWQYNLVYKFNKFISTEFGKGNNFIGHGYRSLLLSNLSSVYPYLKIKTEFGKVKYYNIYTTFLNPNMSNYGRKKHSTIHYLDYAITKNINFGVFESILWQSKSEEVSKGFELSYLNPVIFYRPVEFSKHSNKGNALMGATLKIQFKQISFYGQFLLDDLNISRQKDSDDNYQGGFFQNKYGYQLGFKGNIEDVNFIIEYNQVQPYTYGHRTILQNYSHMNQSLAHPLGANFKEYINILEMKRKKWRYRIYTMFAVVGLDSLGTHYGQNIFASDYDASTGGMLSYGNVNGQGVSTNIILFQPEISYKFKVFEIFGTIHYREKKSNLIDQTNLFFSIGFRNFPFSSFTDY